MQQSIQLQAQNQANAQAQQQQAQQMMMNQNSMQGQGPRNMLQQPGQQGFHHLQHQMQASPIPGQQPQQLPMGLPNEGMAQNLTQQQFMAIQQQQQQQAQQQQQQQHQQPENMPNRQQPPSQQDAIYINELAGRLMMAATVEEKASIRANVQARMDPQILQNYQSKNIDPIIAYYRQQAAARLKADKQQRMAQQQAQQAQLNNVSQQQAQNIPTTAPPMQQQRSMNPSPLNGQTQAPTSMGPNPDFGFGNMGNIIDQQNQGVMAQETGQMVVPANAQRNSTPQPPGLLGQMNMNNQQAVPNPNARTAQHQQQMYAQAQQQRMQQVAQQQQQSQAAARANAQAKAQQIGLQGQPGGMGSGPMPPQQSPAMATLNTPLRPPSQQQNHPEPPNNPNGQFGQPLDPRFMQGNQRPMNPAVTFNPAMLHGMPQEQQARLAGLPPDKLAEVVNRWHEQRSIHNQAGRPPMPMQGNNQFRPGQQIPQPGQFNTQNALTQFMLANPGQRPPQALAGTMTPQQQMMLQQQVARMQQNPNQPRNMPQNLTPIEQRTFMQMDNVDFPVSLMTHVQMPRGVPGEIKKWGPLKQWVQQNPTMPPDAIENVKSLQKIHYQSLVRARNQAAAGQPQPMAIPPGQGGPGTAPTIPPGLSAPVAPMGQGQMQLPNGMNMNPAQMRQPTPQEIQNARSHPSGKMASLSDDQIRAVLMRNHISNQHIQRQQTQIMQQQQMQMANQLSQLNGQQPRPPPGPGQPVNMTGAGQNQPQPPQAKQPPPPAEPAPSTNNNRSIKPPTNRAAVQTASPAAPAKNLKRANSDDVIEVPNPNAQRSTPQQNQGLRPPPSQARPNLTPQQVAELSPENRKKYEAALLRVQQSNPNMAKLKSIMEEEVTKSREALPDIPMDPETMKKVATMLRDMHTHLTNMAKAIPKWYAMTRDDARARDFFRTVCFQCLDYDLC